MFSTQGMVMFHTRGTVDKALTFPPFHVTLKTARRWVAVAKIIPVLPMRSGHLESQVTGTKPHTQQEAEAQ